MSTSQQSSVSVYPRGEFPVSVLVSEQMDGRGRGRGGRGRGGRRSQNDEFLDRDFEIE